MNVKIDTTKQTSVSFGTYIIRLYHFKKNNPQRLLGIVEEVETREKSSFANYDELWKIINSSKVRSKKQGI
jgi:hypothetical protein